MENQLKKKINLTKLKEKLLSTRGLVTGTVVVILLLSIVFIVESCAPRKGSIIYGICSSFLEQQVTFPQSLNYTSVEQYPKAVRIYFTYTDAFGQYQFEFAECTFRQDPQQGVQLERVFFNYAKEITESQRMIGKGRLYQVRQEVIDLFNRSQSSRAILENNPNLDLPTQRGYRF